MEFGDKLKYVMRRFGVSNTVLAQALYVDPAQVSHWRSGRRRADRQASTKIARTLVAAVTTETDRMWLESLPGSSDLPVAERLELWLWDGKPVEKSGLKDSAQAGVCYPGAEGFVKAVHFLARGCAEGQHPVQIYLSSERVRLIAHREAGDVWHILHRLNGRPVPVYLEQSQDAESAAELVSSLLPHMQAGHLELHCIPSNRRYFCYHITVLARDAGLVMTTEPETDMGDSVSMFVGASPFTDAMACSLSALHSKSEPLLRLLRDRREEDRALLQCYQPGGEYSVRLGSLNLLYLDPEQYREMMKLNGANYDTRRYHLNKFRESKSRFEEYLNAGRYREIVSLSALEFLNAGDIPAVPDLGFLKKERIQLPNGFAAGLIRGMESSLERYPGMEILLLPDSLDPTVNLRIKEDCLMLWQMMLEGQVWTTTTGNWPLVLEFHRRFDEL